MQTVAVMDEPMAKKNAKPDTSMRIDGEVAAKLKKVATLKGMTMAEYMRRVVLPIIERDLKIEGKKLGGD